MIEITKFEFVQKGALVAKFNIKMHKWGGLLINECTLFESGSKRWITLPSKQYESEGKKKYFSYLRYEDRDMNDRFLASIMKSVDEHIESLRKTQPSHEVKSERGQYDDIPF